MAVTIGTPATFKTSTSAFPWSFTSTATVDTSSAVALLVFVSSAGNNHASPTVKYQNVTMSLLVTVPIPAGTPSGYLWAYGLVTPVQTTTGTITLTEAQNGDGSDMVVIPITSCKTSASPWGATGSSTSNGGTATKSIVTTAANSRVLTGITALFGPATSGWTTTGTQTVTTVATANTDTSAPVKVVSQTATTSGTTVTVNNALAFNNQAVLLIEVLDGGAAPANYTQSVSDTYTLSETFLATFIKAGNLLSFGDTYTLSDAIIRFPKKVVSETSLPMTETFKKATTKLPWTETFSLSETFAKLTKRPWTESISLSETFLKGTLRSWSETFSVSETFSKLTARAWSETFSISETFSKLTARAWSEVLSVVDTYAQTYFPGATGTLYTRSFSDSWAGANLLSNPNDITQSPWFISGAGTSVLSATTLQCGSSVTSLANRVTSPAAGTYTFAVTLAKVSGADGSGQLNIYTPSYTLLGGSSLTAISSTPQTLTVTVAIDGTTDLLVEVDYTAATAGSVQSVTSTSMVVTGSGSIVDSLARQPRKALLDTVSLGEQLIRLAGKVVIESCSLTETFVRGAFKSLTETLSPSDVFSRFYSGLRSFTESIGVSDSGSRSAGKRASETIAVSDSAPVRAMTTGKNDTVGVSDAGSRQAGKVATETFTITDAYSRVLSKILSLLDTVPPSDAIVRSCRKVWQDTFSVTDLLGILQARLLVLTDAFASLSDSLTKQGTKALSDTLSVGDTCIRGVRRVFSEVLSITDALDSFGVQKLLSFLETFGLSDTLARSVQRAFLETLNPGEILNRQTWKTWTDSVAVTDAGVKRSTVKSALDSVSVSDGMIRQTRRSFIETAFSISDAWSVLRAQLLSLSDTLGVSDSLARWTGKRALDTVSPSDTVTRSTGKVMNDTFSLAEIFAKTKAQLLMLADTLGISDTITRFTGRVMSDSVAVNDTITRFLRRAYLDTLTWSDTLTRQAGKALNETYSVTDAMKRAISKAVLDSVSVNDSLSKAFAILLSLADTLGISDGLARSTNKVVNENLAVTETLLRSTARGLADSFDSFTDRLAKRVATAFHDVYEIVDEIDAGRVFAHFLTFVETFLLVDRIVPLMLHQVLRSLPSKIARYFQPGKTANDSMSERPHVDHRVTGGSVNDRASTREKKPRRWY
jgi:hypothetical protein